MGTLAYNTILSLNSISVLFQSGRSTLLTTDNPPPARPARGIIKNRLTKTGIQKVKRQRVNWESGEFLLSFVVYHQLAIG